MLDEILYTIKTAPMKYFVYSSVSFFASRRGGELPGSWFIAAAEALGRNKTSMRQTLYRMEADGALGSRKVGRVKYYRPAVSAQQEIEAGLHKFFGTSEAQWNGEWTIVRFLFDAARRTARERIRAVLAADGFAALGSGVFVHPRDRSHRVLKAVTASGLSKNVAVFRGKRLGDEPDIDVVKRLWNLNEIQQGYTDFLTLFSGLQSFDADDLTSLQHFAVRFALVFEYLEVAWTDPELPPELLPKNWKGDDARTLAKTLYEKFLGGAITFSDALIAEMTLPETFPTTDPLT